MAVVVPGPMHVTMQSFNVPTPGSRPHDPLVTRDGALWYTGQMVNALGRIDPRTGQAREFQLKTPHSGPHGLVEDKGGNIWYTGNAGALVGKLDPKTGTVTEYKMPDPSVGDPHTLQFDHQGILWFTAQNANRIGRLDPATGEIKLVALPTAGSRPYGMAVNSKNMVFVVQFGTNGVASVDPTTMAVREYKLPNAGAHVIWYSESEATPNTVVRFDPKSEKFQSWTIPGGGYIVRNTSVTANGDFVLANSLANQVTLVKIPK